MNDRPAPRRMTATEALRHAVQSALPVDVGRQQLVTLPLTRYGLEALADVLDRMHTRATLGDLPTEGNHELYALADAAQLARAAAQHGYPRLIGAGFGAEVAAEARRSPSSRLTDPATSKAAGEAKHREPTHANHLGRLLLAFLDDDDPTATPSRIPGLTSEEAARRANLPLTSEHAKRCSELRDGGYLTVSQDDDGHDRTRAGRSGRQKLVWALTGKGRAAAAALRE